MDAILYIVIGIVVLVVIALIVVAVMRRRNETNLQDRFGPEYDRQVDAHGKRGATQHLKEVADKRDQLDIRQLPPGARDQYSRRWEAVQTDFVDRPGPALDEADRLVVDVMRERGYPVDDFEQRAEIVAADHPQVVEHYRAAHAATQHSRGTGGHADTEQLRQAFVHYRALFVELVQDGGSADRDPSTTR